MNNFIYYIKQLNSRFCVSINCVKNIFKTIHNLNVYSKHYRTYVRFVDIVYIHKMFKLFIIYIKHCFLCQFNQTTKHKLYNELILILTFRLSYYIIKINFIVALLKQLKKCNAILTIIDKNIKKKY